MSMEKRGLPTVLICPEAFRGIVEAQARLSGLPSFKAVTVPGQLVGLSPQESAAKIDQVADKIIDGLVAPSA